MSVAIVLPARLASTRLPRKLLLDRTGRALLEHTIDRALAARDAHPELFTTVLVACDDAELLKAARRARADAVMTDPALPSGTDRVAAAAKDLAEDVVVNLQADEPEVDPEALAKAARVLTGGTAPDGASFPPDPAPMSTLATPLFDEAAWRKPNVVKVVVDRSGHALYFSRAPIPFVREPYEVKDGYHALDAAGQRRRIFGYHHLGLYAYRKDFLFELTALKPSHHERMEKLEQLRVLDHGYKIAVRLVDKHPPGIDTPEDYDAFVERFQAQGGALPTGRDLADFHAEWMDKDATFYGH
ncbi:MAG: 3-deoxy-manno-octulosonate cytidylyltransferase [Planctomycetota bacterium]|nr:3-deoxy-manno-octulosonate cytidylyltransferase [Planctomycetota bacterium]